MRFLIFGGLLALIVWLMLVRPTPEDLRRYMKRGALIGVAALLIFAAATGRMHWLFALIGSLLPFANRLLGLLRFLPMVDMLLDRMQRGRGAGPRAGRQSSVATDYLRMSLDHDSGEMDGEILQGTFAGRRLSALSIEQLQALGAELAAADQESATLLHAYMERMRGEDSQQQRQQGSAPRHGGAMSTEEALQILGLEAGASPGEIRAAHRRLMQKLHPDRGGSDYLAAKINRAKDVLLAG